MQYCSTRGGVGGWSFRDVLFSGYAPDGGMFMPETLPVLDPDRLRSWRGLSYPKVVVEVASLFIPPQLIPRDDLGVLVGEALSGFSVPEVVRVARLKDGLTVLELFHGETLAFKDLAMSCTVHFLSYFLKKESRRAIVVVGTSGDTGGSAIQSAKGVPGLDVVVVYPRGRVTPVQEKHMTTCLEDNVHVFAAGFIVKQMGVPLRLVAMVNSNDIVHRTVTRGDFSMADEVTQTLATAIDIQDPYNMERVFWLLLGRDGASVKAMMEEFQRSHRHSLSEEQRRLLSSVLTTGAVSDEGILETMRRCWEENQYLLCPHSAVAVWHHYHCPHSGGVNRCYVATASPAKFQAAVQRAGLPFSPPAALQALDGLPSRCQELRRSADWSRDWEDRLRRHIQDLDAARKSRSAPPP
ncbi:threonine synthase-like 2 isoform X2 [Oryzias melastigma]|uniref:threonine synthase-like 2 isoform X2 n=1 Tax=Oryzias melastigma TaxID=30732 RepID=UPI000CF83598|nr:threonine synthase-like 2 isoform X2 [Oryzias melastigma]